MPPLWIRGGYGPKENKCVCSMSLFWTGKDSDHGSWVVAPKAGKMVLYTNKKIEKGLTTPHLWFWGTINVSS